jgi:hypothetical protein
MNNEMLDLKREKAELHSKYTNKFLGELAVIMDKCFLPNKNKKEQLISREKIEIELIKLLQSQKKFQVPTDLNLTLLAVFDTDEMMCGRIKNINMETKEIEFVSITGHVKTKSMKVLSLFDVYTPSLQIMYERQRKFFDSFSYKDTFTFLTSTPTTTIYPNLENSKQQTVRYGLTCDPKKRTVLTIPINYDK